MTARAVRAVGVVGLGLLIGGCEPGAERAGDEAYLAGRYADAYAAYVTAAGDDGEGEVWIKAGAAAAKAGMRDSAVAAYLRAAATDPERRQEAADALEELARTAERAGELETLRRAAVALWETAPERPIGRYTTVLLSRAAPEPGEAADLLPDALAAAPAGAAFDSLLLKYGKALAATGQCDAAVAAFRGVLRRSADTARRAESGIALARCALTLGDSALAAGHAVDADRWYTVAAQVDSASTEGRRALIGIGDARVAQGDTIAAMIVWGRAGRRNGGKAAGDSIAALAEARIRAFAGTDTAGDSGRMGEQ